MEIFSSIFTFLSPRPSNHPSRLLALLSSFSNKFFLFKFWAPSLPSLYSRRRRWWRRRIAPAGVGLLSVDHQRACITLRAIYLCVHVCACVCMCVNVCACVCMCVHVRAYACTCVHVCACVWRARACTPYKLDILLHTPFPY